MFWIPVCEKTKYRYQFRKVFVMILLVKVELDFRVVCVQADGTLLAKDCPILLVRIQRWTFWKSVSALVIFLVLKPNLIQW